MPKEVQNAIEGKIQLKDPSYVGLYAGAKIYHEYLQSLPQPSRSIEILMRDFCEALKEKSLNSIEKYGYSEDAWRDDVTWQDVCNKELIEHIQKGDPRDVAIYCAFMWHHGWKTFLPQPSDDMVMEVQEAIAKRMASCGSGPVEIDLAKLACQIAQSHINKAKEEAGNLMLESAKELNAAADRIIALEKERDHLQKFKDFVHTRLDAMGVEKNPDGIHSKEGCRIGDRLDIVEKTPIGFAEWILRQNLIMIDDSGDFCWEGHNKRFTSEKLYSIYLQSLNK